MNSASIIFATLIFASTSHADEIAAEPATGESKYSIEVTPGAPPFDNIDDPKPPDLGDIEANVFAQGDHISGCDHSIDAPYFDLNYGALKSVQLKWEGWYAFNHNCPGQANSGSHDGVGNNLVGVKWMFLNGEDLSGLWHNLNVAVYPQLQFAPVSRSVDNGVADGGKIYILPLLVSKAFDINGRPFAVTINAGYNHGIGGQPDSVNEGLAFGTAIASQTSMMISASHQHFNNDQPDSKKYELGIVHVPKFMNDFSVFAMVGTAKDDRDHIVWAVGFQKIIHTKKTEETR